MKRNIFRFLSVIVAVVLLAALSLPSFASAGSQYEQKVSFWDWIAGKGSILNGFVGNTVGRVCPKSEDGYHHANSYQFDRGNGYYTCICSYCGHEFEAYESDLQQSYQQQVESLPASTITQNSLYMLYFCDFTYGKSALLSGDSLLYETYLSAVLSDSVGAKWSCYTLSQYGGASYGDICAKSALLYVPYDGAYRFDATLTHAYGHYFTSNSNRNYFQLYKSDGTKFFEGSNEGTIVNLSAGYYFCYFNTRYCFKGQGAEFSATFSGYPSLKLLGIDGIGLQPVSNVYATTTRPTAITGGNGRGKTSIADAIAFAVTGLPFFGERGLDRLHNEANPDVYVQMRFVDENSTPHELTRTRQKNRMTIHYDGYEIRQMDLSDLFGEKDVFLSIFNPLYFIEELGDTGKSLLEMYLPRVSQEEVLTQLTEPVRRHLEKEEILSPEAYLCHRQ